MNMIKGLRSEGTEVQTITRIEYRRTESGEEGEVHCKDGAGGVERKGHINRWKIRGT
jgi:hypothetical protein